MWLLIIPVLYAALVTRYIHAWKRISFFKPKQQRPDVLISVVIAVRNEEHRIQPLLQSLIAQQYPAHLFEILFVNDHSSDQTIKCIQTALQNTPLHFKILNLPQNHHGKKAAITHAIQQAQHGLIITTDADCSMTPHWLATIAGYYSAHAPVMMVMPVVLTGHSFFSKLQAQEFLALMGSTGASLQLQTPLMCNGANLAFEKTAYNTVNTQALRHDVATGDDTFLMLQLFKTYSNKIHYVKSVDALVSTPALPALLSFMQQRIRWAAKVKSYSQGYILITGLLVLLMAATQLFCLAQVFCSVTSTQLLRIAAVFILKMLVDYTLIYQTAKDLNQRFSCTAFICWQFLYPFYVIITGVAALFGVYSWKGRKY